MDMQSALVARLKAASTVASALSGRLFWVIVPQATALPYGQMQTISDPRPQHLAGYDQARSTRVQFDVYANTYEAARAACEAIINEMAGPATVFGVRFGRSKAEGPRDLSDENTTATLKRLSFDLIIEHTTE